MDIDQKDGTVRLSNGCVISPGLTERTLQTDASFIAATLEYFHDAWIPNMGRVLSGAPEKYYVSHRGSAESTIRLAVYLQENG
jgi:hypothetical protein